MKILSTMLGIANVLAIISLGVSLASVIWAGKEGSPAIVLISILVLMLNMASSVNLLMINLGRMEHKPDGIPTT